MYKNFDNSSGTLNKAKQKKSEKSPDYMGSIVLDEEAVRYLVGKIKAGEKLPKISISAWLVDGKNGKFISMKMAEPQATQAPQKSGFSDDLPF